MTISSVISVNSKMKYLTTLQGMGMHVLQQQQSAISSSKEDVGVVCVCVCVCGWRVGCSVP